MRHPGKGKAMVFQALLVHVLDEMPPKGPEPQNPIKTSRRRTAQPKSGVIAAGLARLIAVRAFQAMVGRVGATFVAADRAQDHLHRGDGELEPHHKFMGSAFVQAAPAPTARVHGEVLFGKGDSLTCRSLSAKRRCRAVPNPLACLVVSRRGRVTAGLTQASKTRRMAFPATLSWL